jgi:hypothetical protein
MITAEEPMILIYLPIDFKASDFSVGSTSTILH